MNRLMDISKHNVIYSIAGKMPALPGGMLREYGIMVNDCGRDARAPKKPSIRQVILASFIGTSIEWYDFFLYGTAAALVFNKLFFPTISPLAGSLSGSGTFAVGFVARPFGGVLCGHYGDKIGRKSMLVYSLLIMG